MTSRQAKKMDGLLDININQGHQILFFINIINRSLICWINH